MDSSSEEEGDLAGKTTSANGVEVSATFIYYTINKSIRDCHHL